MNCASGFVDVVRHAHELNPRARSVDGKRHVACARVPVLGTANASGVDELNSSDHTLPRFMGVPKANDILCTGAETLRHLLEKRVRSVRGHVNRIQRLIAVDESDRRARYVTAERANVQTEGKAAQISLRLRRDVRAGPLEREVR